MSDHKNYTLQDVLGWTKQDGVQTPFLSFHDTVSTPSDILLAAYITQCMSSNTPLCLVGIRYGFNHFQSLCKRLGVSLDDCIRKGLLYFIDCTQSTLPSTLPSPSDASTTQESSNQPQQQPSSTSLPLPDFAAIYQRVVVSSLMVNKRNAPPSTSQIKSDRFSICIDDLSTLAQLTMESIPSTISFLHQLYQLRGSSGTLCVSVTTPPPITQTHPSSTASHPPTPPLFIPEVNPDSTFDLPVNSHGLSSAIARLASTLVIASQKSHGDDDDEPSPSSLCIEISPLSSGYSKDIYAQLTIFRPPSAVGIHQSPMGKSAISGHISVVYLHVDNNGQLACHARA